MPTTTKSSISDNSIELSIVMPCLNESGTLGSCITKALGFLEREKVVGEVVVADNGSTDGSIDIAEALGARVIHVAEKGYGNALRAGIEGAKGKYVIMGDSDDTYDFSKLDLFLEQLRAGREIVAGNRFKGGIAKGAMPFLHQYLGNPVLSFLARIFFKGSCGDYHCGLRGFSKEAYYRLDMQATGMEFINEQIVKACLFNFDLVEVPTTLSPGPEGRVPHLRTWRDGWRNLRFMLMMSPKWLFLLPGSILATLGILVSVLVLSGAFTHTSIHLSVHSLLGGIALIEVGLQILFFGILVRLLAVKQGWLPAHSFMENAVEKFHLEWSLVASIAGLLAGISLCCLALLRWFIAGFGDLDIEATMMIFIPGVGLVMLSLQILFFSFVLAIIRSRN